MKPQITLQTASRIAYAPRSLSGNGNAARVRSRLSHGNQLANKRTGMRVAGGKTLNLRIQWPPGPELRPISGRLSQDFFQVLGTGIRNWRNVRHRIPMHHPCTPSAVNSQSMPRFGLRVLMGIRKVEKAPWVGGRGQRALGGLLRVFWPSGRSKGGCQLTPLWRMIPYNS